MANALNNLPDVLLVGVLIAIFVRLGKWSTMIHVPLWITAWCLVLTHFTVDIAASLVPEKVLDFVGTEALALSGIFFLASLLLRRELSRFSVTALVVAAAAEAFSVGLVICGAGGAWLIPMAIVMILGQLPVLLGRKPKEWGYPLLCAVAFLSWAVVLLSRGSEADRTAGFVAAMAFSFFTCGILYWRREPRISTGPMACTLGFFAWGLVFPVATLFQTLTPWLNLPGGLWNVPKIVVAIGMVVVLLENQARGAIRSAEKYRNLFEHNLAGVFRATLDGQILECNDAFLQIFGTNNTEDWTCTTLRDGATTEPTWPELCYRLEAEGAARGQECRVRRRDGRDLHLLANLTLVAGDAGHPGDVVEGTLFDITGNKKMEQQLRAAMRLEAIGRLAGGVAHDVNNVLQAVILPAQLMLRTEHDPEKRTRLKGIITSAEKGAAVSRQLLTFSRKEAYASQATCLNKALREMRPILRQLLREDVELSMELNATRDLANITSAELDQVIINLAVNAQDAMDRGGRLVIRCSNREADGEEEEMLELSIVDNACGMSPETVEHAFEPFFTTKSFGNNSGLGLAIVYGIVQQRGGKLTIDSTPGEGTAVHILLPLATDAAEVRTLA
jgi:PAS domain S-box-containing protein